MTAVPAREPDIEEVHVMKKLALLVLLPAALWASGCGDSCTK